jgi:uncharacterized protein
MTADKTGAPTTVAAESGRFTISVDGQQVGFARFADRDGHRWFMHTEVDKGHEGRGLATILIAEALQQTRDAGLRVVAKCPMVYAYLKKHDQYRDIDDSDDN